MRSLPLATLTIGLCLLAGAANAACSREPAPAVPDGSVASIDEMKSAQQAIKTFQEKNAGYLACLEGEAKSAGEKDTDEAKAARVASYNAAVDEETALAERFNAAVQAYKARK